MAFWTRARIAAVPVFCVGLRELSSSTYTRSFTFHGKVYALAECSPVRLQGSFLRYFFEHGMNFTYVSRLLFAATHTTRNNDWNSSGNFRQDFWPNGQQHLNWLVSTVMIFSPSPYDQWLINNPIALTCLFSILSLSQDKAYIFTEWEIHNNK